MALDQRVVTYAPISGESVVASDLRSPQRRMTRAAEWALLQRVTTALDLDPSLDLSDVDVEIEGSDVILLGSVPGPSTKARIERAVAGLDGVRGVVNQLVVGPPAATSTWFPGPARSARFVP